MQAYLEMGIQKVRFYFLFFSCKRESKLSRNM